MTQVAGDIGTRGWQRNNRPAVDVNKLFDRLPPHSPEAEMSLLGSMILDPQVVGEVLTFVDKPEAFYEEKHAAIFKALIGVYERHQSGDLVELIESLRDAGSLDHAGGADYLVRLAESVPSAANAPHYARIVAEKHRLRRLIDAAGRILYDAFHAGQLGPEGAREVIDVAEMAVFEVAHESDRSDPQKLADLLQKELERLEKSDGKAISGLPTGYPDLDRLLSGLQPGEMIVVAGRPSMGKTALALNLAEQIATGGATPHTRAVGAPVPVGVFSLEMTKTSVVQRLLSAYSGIDSHRLRNGQVAAGEWAKLDASAISLSEAPIFIDDMPNLSILALRARARRMIAQHQVRALMVDYLQLLSAPAQARESRQVEVSAISRGLKALAHELNIPIICLAQLNRAAESREGNRPRMSDLRESGSIEQDADVVILIHREDYYHLSDREWLDANADRVGVTELIIAKQRNGPTGVVELMWNPHITRFVSYDARSHAPPGGGGTGSRFSGDEDDPFAGPRTRQSPPPRPTGTAGLPGGGLPAPDEDDVGDIPI